MNHTTKLQRLKKTMPAPSTFATPSMWSKKQHELTKESLELKCHRPPYANSTHVSLYYPDFCTFVVECSSQEVDATDAAFILKLTSEMSEKYELEQHRVRVFLDLLNDYLKLGVPAIPQGNTDGAIVFENPLTVRTTF